VNSNDPSDWKAGIDFDENAGLYMEYYGSWRPIMNESTIENKKSNLASRETNKGLPSSYNFDPSSDSGFVMFTENDQHLMRFSVFDQRNPIGGQ
jgi:hypothetical protein